MIKKLMTILMLAGLTGSLALADNLIVTNVTLRPINRQSAGIELDLSWDNSWRDTWNHDAVWLFAKYSLDGGSNWQHVTLNGTGVNPPQYVKGTNAALEIVVPVDRKGAFVRRTGEGRGAFGSRGLRLVWDLQADGIEVGAKARVSVQALEMVYIPAGPFYVGDNGSPGTFKVTYINTAAMTNTSVSGSGTLASPYTNMTVGMGRPQGITGTYDTNYPNGFKAFYCMKYELSRASYLDFLNLLTTSQVATLRSIQVNFGGSSGTIGGIHPNLTNAQPWRALLFGVQAGVGSYSGSREWLAFLDWAGMRPLTEMEYEKACRGPSLPVDRDFPWGTASRCLVNRITNVNTAAERKFDLDANLVAGGTPGVLQAVAPGRCGFLSGPSTDHFQSGASYYGVMEMAGNVSEKCVLVGHATANAFSGVHGDGVLNADGTANVANWPYQTATSYSNGSIGSRGGYYGVHSLNCTVATRRTDNYYPDSFHGIRGVRTAPEAP